MKKNIDILRLANQKRRVEVPFELDLDGTIIKLVMKNPDPLQIARIQEVAKAKEKAEAAKKGLHLFPIDNEKWENFRDQNTAGVTNKKDRKNILKELDKNKPANLAEQIALEASWYETAKQILPMLIYDDNELFFDTSEELEIYYETIKNIDIFALMMGKFTELISKSNLIGQAAKNLPASNDLN